MSIDMSYVCSKSMSNGMCNDIRSNCITIDMSNETNNCLNNGIGSDKSNSLYNDIQQYL